MIEIVMCRGCHVFNRPEDLSLMLIHPDGRNEPYTEGPLCSGCVEARKAEVDEPAGFRAVLEVTPLAARAMEEDVERRGVT